MKLGRKNVFIKLFIILIFMLVVTFTTISYLYSKRNISSSDYLKLLLNYNFNDNIYHNIVEGISNNLNPLKLLDIEVENKKFDISNNIVIDPIIYIYNKDQKLDYKKEFNITPTVFLSSYYLCNKLNEENISCIFEDTDIDKFLSNNNISKEEAIDIFKQDKKDNYKTIKYFIELGRSNSLSSITYNKNKYGRINLYANGNNISFVTNLNNKLNEKIPGISKIYFDLEYNTSIMIDIGGKNNNMTEIINSIKVLSISIKEVLNEE